MARPVRSEVQRLRQFGWVMTTAFALVGAFLWWRGRPATPYVAAAAAFFFVSALLAPRALQPLERIWMAFARVLQTIMTTIILALTFFVVMTPLGTFLRLIGKDLLGKKPDKDCATYWVPTEADGPGSRPDKPY